MESVDSDDSVDDVTRHLHKIVTDVVRNSNDDPEEVQKVAHILQWEEFVTLLVKERAGKCLSSEIVDEHQRAYPSTFNRHQRGCVPKQHDLVRHLASLLPTYPYLTSLLTPAAQAKLFDEPEFLQSLGDTFVTIACEKRYKRFTHWWHASGASREVLVKIVRGGYLQPEDLCRLCKECSCGVLYWIHRHLASDESAQSVFELSLAREKMLPKLIQKYSRFIPFNYLHSLAPSKKHLLFDNNASGSCILDYLNMAVMTNNHALIKRVIRYHSFESCVPIPGLYGFSVIDRIFDTAVDEDMQDLVPDRCGFDCSPQAVASTRALVHRLRYGGPCHDTFTAIPRQALPKCRSVLLLRQRLESTAAADGFSTLCLPLLPHEIWCWIIHNVYRCPLITVAEHNEYVRAPMLTQAAAIRDTVIRMADALYGLCTQHSFTDKLPENPAEEHTRQNTMTRSLARQWRIESKNVVDQLNGFEETFSTMASGSTGVFEELSRNFNTDVLGNISSSDDESEGDQDDLPELVDLDDGGGVQ